MQRTAFDFPDSINELVVDDALFARAYQDIPAYRRALLKTGIARLYDWYGPVKATSGREVLRWRSGLDSVHDCEPVDFVVVVFDETLQSPARLLAAVVPAMACGVKNILAVRLGQGDWPQSVLVGLELAGQELVVDMTADALKGVLAEMGETGATGVVLGVDMQQGTFRSLRFPSRRIEFRCLKCERQAAVWMDGDAPFDLEALAFAQPDMTFTVHGQDVSLPSAAFSRGGPDISGFLDSVREVAYTPASRVDEALDRARLVLGPGHEGCWLWPQLRPEHFQFHSTAWTIGA